VASVHGVRNVSNAENMRTDLIKLFICLVGRIGRSVVGAVTYRPDASEANTKLFHVVGRFWLDGEGSAIVEAAVVLPVMVALLTGVFEFAWYFYDQQLIETGLRDAARYMSQISIGDPCTATDPGGTLYSVYAKNLAVYGSQSATSTPRVDGWQTSNVSITCQTYDNSKPYDTKNGYYYNGESTLYFITASTCASGCDTASANTNFAYTPLGLFHVFGLTAPTISISHQERSIGP
jgi:Flp pilus assembly protein TadG